MFHELQYYYYERDSMQITIRPSKPDCCSARLGVLTTLLCESRFYTIVCVSILCESTDKPKAPSVECALSLYRTELRNPLISDQHCCWFVSSKPNRIVRRMCWKIGWQMFNLMVLCSSTVFLSLLLWLFVIVLGLRLLWLSGICAVVLSGTQ